MQIAITGKPREATCGEINQMIKDGWAVGAEKNVDRMYLLDPSGGSNILAVEIEGGAMTITPGRLCLG